MKKLLLVCSMCVLGVAVVEISSCRSTTAPAGSIDGFAPIPESITTSDVVETRLGTLEFFDGYPSKETVETVYDHLDFLRGVRAFLDLVPIASLSAMRAGLREVGCVDGTVGIYEELMDSRSLFLTPNTESIYAFTWIDLSDGPVVVESPPNTLGMVNDHFFRYVADLGNAGTDRGKGTTASCSGTSGWRCTRRATSRLPNRLPGVTPTPACCCSIPRSSRAARCRCTSTPSASDWWDRAPAPSRCSA